MSQRTTCYECGEELWGPQEACGFCVMCQRRERELNDERLASPDEPEDD